MNIYLERLLFATNRRIKNLSDRWPMRLAAVVIVLVSRGIVLLVLNVQRLSQLSWAQGLSGVISGSLVSEDAP